MQGSELKNIVVPVGKLVQVRSKDGLFTGVVTENYSKHFVVQGEGYRQSFLKADLVIGTVGIQSIKAGQSQPA